MSYSSQYPKIIMDTSTNSVNDSLAKKLTVEEYYDLLHHTHTVSSLIGSVGGDASYDGITNIVNTLSDTVNSLVNTVQIQQETINELKAQLNSLIHVKDWDVNTPGNQDVNGNDLGELMGFQMTEIV